MKHSLIIVTILLSTACSPGPKQNIFKSWLTERSATEPVAIQLICDPSPGSICNEKTLSTSLESITTHVSEQPGSTIELWMTGESAAEATLVETALVTKSKSRSHRAAVLHAARWMRTTKARLLQRSRPYFRKQLRRSPIAETLTIVASVKPVGRVRRMIILLSDLREVSGVCRDMECGELPKEHSWLACLHRHHALMPHSLSGISLYIPNYRLVPVDGNRCQARLDRLDEIGRLWTAAARAAGAERVDISAAPLRVDHKP
jgi:hypothetical protein